MFSEQGLTRLFVLGTNGFQLAGAGVKLQVADKKGRNTLIQQSISEYSKPPPVLGTNQLNLIDFKARSLVRV